MSDANRTVVTPLDKLPTLDGEIDWDRVAPRYFDFILSPYAPAMVQGCEQGQGRNLLLNYLYALPSGRLDTMNILDMGCGPGNLLAHIQTSTGENQPSLTGIDTSKVALRIATRAAQEHNICFHAVHENIMRYTTDTRYDLIISSNSILPNSRQEVHKIFSRLSGLLSDNGALIAILPSFDTTEYLHALRVNETPDTPPPVADKTKLAYADDGCHLQCYHTAASICEETAGAGLTLKFAPQKVYYPWSLCQQFGYGYFPQAPEEIWDWFIVAQKAPS